MKEKILQLISDPFFIKLQNLINEPNMFKIVGRTHTERWHSAFWGWLLDVNGSHNLNDYPITRLFTLLTKSEVFKPDEQNIISFFPYKKLTISETRPNEIDGSEVSIETVGRFDIYIELEVKNINDKDKKVSIIIELKIDSKIKAEQSKRYADWQFENKTAYDKILIYFIPDEYLNENSRKTVGDNRWFCLSYQLLHDNLLIPILNHPSLSLTAKLIIEQYVKNMRLTNKGIKMATTQEERDLINFIYEKYQSVFENIFEVLELENKIEEPILSKAPRSGRNRGKIIFEFDNNKYEGRSGADALEKVLKYIVDNDKIKQIPLPWGTGTQRYILAYSSNPVHPNGRDFFYPVEYNNFIIETHWDRNRTMKIISDIAKKINVDYNLIEV